MSRYRLMEYDDPFMELDFGFKLTPMMLDTETGNMFPLDEKNAEYQAYLVWLAGTERGESNGV